MIRNGIFGAALLTLAAPILAQEETEWRPVDAETGQIRDVEGLKELAAAFPESGSVRLRMLQPLLEAGEIEQLLEVLEWLGERGYVFGEVSRQQIPRLVGEEHAQSAQDLLIPQAEIIAASEVVATVPADAGLVESVFQPPGEVVFVATSITRKALYIKEGDRDWLTVPIPGAGDLSGIVSSPDGMIGWVASGNVDGSADDSGFSGIIGLTGDFNNPEGVEAPAGVTVSDLALGPDGTVYASDPLTGGVYFAVPGEHELEELVAPGTLRSAQGLAVSDDGLRLYVSDYRYGIAIVDLTDLSVDRLGSDVPVILDGTDGLWLHDGELIAVQNGTSPMRISAFRLSEDGMRVIEHRVLEQANPEWTEPLGGSIADDTLVYVGTGQWDLYVDGELAQDAEPRPTQIRRLPLSP